MARVEKPRLLVPMYVKIGKGQYMRMDTGEVVPMPPEELYLVMAKEGLYQHKRGVFWESSVRIWDGEKKDLGFLAGEKESLELLLPKKVPYDLLAKAIGFFRKIFRKYQAEAILILYWNPEKTDYELLAPEQTVSGGGLKYEPPKPTPKGLVQVGTIHSHCEMSGFHSGTDQHDEQHDDGVHITIGKVSSVPEFAVSIVSDGLREKITLEEVFDDTPDYDFPTEWVKKVRKGVIPPRVTSVNLHTRAGQAMTGSPWGNFADYWRKDLFEEPQVTGAGSGVEKEKKKEEEDSGREYS